MRVHILLFVVLVTVSASKKNSLCDICLNLVDAVDNALKHGEDVKKVMPILIIRKINFKAAHDFCSNLPWEFLVGPCEKVIAQSLDFIIDSLKEHKPAKEICENIHLC